MARARYDSATLDAAIRDHLRQIYDPCSVAAGTPISLYDMGLLRGWRLAEDATLTVTLGVTFGACTMAPHFMRAAEESLGRLPGVAAIEVVIDQSFVWSVEQMTEIGRAILAERPYRFDAANRPQPRQWMKGTEPA